MAKGKNNKLSAKHLDCVKHAITSTFASICGEEPVFNGEEENGQSFVGVIGIISMVGEDKALSLMLGFPQDTAKNIAQTFAGFEIEYNSDDMGDVIGELANIVAGDASARLDAVGLRVEISLPTVARGIDISMLISHDVETTHMNFEASSGSFWSKLAIGKDQ